MEPALPRQVKTATECATALDRGDKERARRLAEQGLALATETGDTRWIRRFEHLLKLAKGVPIEGAPYEPPSCSSCLEKGPRNVVAGPKAFICDECVKRCFTQHLDGSAALIRGTRLCSAGVLHLQQVRSGLCGSGGVERMSSRRTTGGEADRVLSSR
jgi:hypothetical protein